MSVSNRHKNITQVFCASKSDNRKNEHVGEVTVKKIRFQLRVDGRQWSFCQNVELKSHRSDTAAPFNQVF